MIINDNDEIIEVGVLGTLVVQSCSTLKTYQIILFKQEISSSNMLNVEWA